MGSRNSDVSPAGDSLAYQAEILPGVSRTFALTIPQLPMPLRTVVTNAYLLCRIADTIEDEAALSPRHKEVFHERFRQVLEGRYDAAKFVGELYPLLSERTIPSEHELIRSSVRVVAVTRGFSARQRHALIRCVTKMSHGMQHFQHNASLQGLATVPALDRYCYCVAGVVGEMLTELFCDYSEEIAQHRDQMARLAVCFGQGLQMTNILKDIWDDRRRDTCWLPQDVFDEEGFDLDALTPERHDEAFGNGLSRLIGLAHGHLRYALSYTLLIPRHETGIRRFCLWAIGLAVLTLQKIHKRPDFTDSRQVKVSRQALRATIIASNLATRSNSAVAVLFNWAARGLPLTPFPACEEVSRVDEGYIGIPTSPEPDL